MALLTYDWHPPDPSGAVNAYLSGVRLGNEQREAAAKLAADALERERLRKRFEQQHELQLQQEARLAGAEKLRQAYQQQRLTNEAAANAPYHYSPSSPSGSLLQPAPDLPTADAPDPASQLLSLAPPLAASAAPKMDITSSEPASMTLAAPAPAATSLDTPAHLTLDAANSLIAGKPASLSDPAPQPEITPWQNGDEPAVPQGGDVQPSGGVMKPIGTVTSYGYAGDHYGGPSASSSTTGPNSNKLDANSLAVSPDIERILTAHGYKLGDNVTLQTDSGAKVTRRWDDRTAQWDPTGQWSIDDKGNRIIGENGKPLPALKGRFDFHAEGSRPSRYAGIQITGVEPKGGADTSNSPSGGIARQIVQPAANDVDSMAQQLARLGVSKKLAEATISRALLDQTKTTTKAGSAAGSTAKPIVRQMADGTTRQYDAGSDSWKVIASKAGPQTREGYMKENYPDGVTAVPEHGTYKRDDGTEFFLNRTATGKISERAFDPERHPARMVDGTDGKKYPVDATGEPMQPLPDGVSLGKFVQPHYSNVKGVGAVMIDSSGEGHVVIPEGLTMPTKVQGEYMDAAKAVAVAQDKLDAQKELLRTKPGFFGGSQKSVDQAQAELNAATKAAGVYLETYPQLKAHALATAGVPSGAPTDDDKVAVISPDGKPGKIPRSQLEAALKAGYRKQ